MRTIVKNFILLSCVFVFGFCNVQNQDIAFDQPNLTYEGRILFRPDAAELSWSGSSVSIQFEGSSISATLQDLDTANYYNVIVDRKVISKLHTDTLKTKYILASGLSEGTHQVQLYKRTEWDKGKTLFYGFELPVDAKLLPAETPKKRKIEFYGNSITSAYGNEDTSGKDRPYGYFQNNYESYAAITARYFNAQYHCISKSGIGVLVSWFPLIMSEMYDRIDPDDSVLKWDFSKYTPDVVVINLFQNDSWIVNIPQNEQFKNRFGKEAPDSTTIIAAYKDFVSSIRGKYPHSSIICTLGSMDATQEGSKWPGYVQTAVSQLEDDKIFSCFFPFKNSGGHPNVKEHHAMSDQLIGFIEENIEW
ncbi:SGNH/GDSL hydrolase family protein [Labilibaculum sp. K2S]|uniref:SGNH/GDSL hydrolase family protein n=1 Tax=Labilibaculum sp. K2S TaxID=3056386 RepID=UPI0025A4B612|nr:SGNH/GDSL hydrolase family protein [Labilibaculum sp. K2S]MDM8159342.1 SGNH/GDSL hydrolase family protein [Labilibaculum sp. K2S]